MLTFNARALVAVGFIVAGVGLPLRSSTTTAPADVNDHVQVIFAPAGDCTGALVKAIRAARTSLKIQMNDLASDAVARELVNAQDRGVFLRVLLGADASPHMAAAARPLLEQDHLVRVDTLRYSPHHVTIIVDDVLVLTGVVQTLADEAVPVDQHVMLIKKTPEVIQRYSRHWLERAETSRLFREVDLTRPDMSAADASPSESGIPSAATSKRGEGVTVYITGSGQRYHIRSCRYAEHGEEVTVQEAVARGKSPCKVCKPPKP